MNHLIEIFEMYPRLLDLDLNQNCNWVVVQKSEFVRETLSDMASGSHAKRKSVLLVAGL
jgi:hypothetical protein